MSMLRIVSGTGAATAQDILTLAMKLGTAAREVGLTVVSIKASHSPGSPSRYVTLRDNGKRDWLIRVSNHRMPINSKHPLPHLDFVSLDGATGLHDATVFLHRLAMGAVQWFDSADPAQRAEFKRLRQRHQARRHRK